MNKDANKAAAQCSDCQGVAQNYWRNDLVAQKIAEGLADRHGRVLCLACQRENKAQKL